VGQVDVHAWVWWGNLTGTTLRPRHRWEDEHFLNRTLGNGLGKLYTTGCEGSRFDHVRKISGRKQGTDIGKYSFVNRTIKNWNQLPAKALGTFPCKLKNLGKKLGKQM
jgi:hypothetical protein